MKWQNRLDDPIPALITEMMARGATHDTSPCSICKNNIDLIKKPGSPRTHFHASDLGACKRRTLYSLRFPLRAKPYTRPEFLLDGHLHETAIFTIMELGADKPQEIDETLKQVYVSHSKNENETLARIPYSVDNGRNEIRELIIVGHTDGLLEMIFDGHGDSYDDRAETFLIECKSVKATKFLKVKKGLMDKEWYGQIQTYLRMKGLKTAFLIVKNRETSETLIPIRVDYDSNYLKKRRAALVEVHTALLDGGMVNREHKDRKNDECRFCKFATECWSKDNQLQRKDLNAESKYKKGKSQKDLEGDSDLAVSDLRPAVRKSRPARTR